jgi:hypothetical protein
MMLDRSEINAHDERGWTALMYACEKGYAMIICTLLSHRADPGIVSHCGETPLMMAAKSGEIDAVVKIFHPDTCGLFDNKGMSALHWACSGDSVEIIDFLVRSGLSVDHRVGDGPTPLEVAMDKRESDSALWLVEHGAQVDVKFKSRCGCTPLMVAIVDGQLKLVRDSDKRLSGRYETVSWFVADNGDYVFNLDPIRILSKEPAKLAYKGENKGSLSGNPLGKNPSDVWKLMMDEWEQSMWDFPNVKANHMEKDHAHPCQFPVELAERCVLAFSNPNALVLDPFCGTGSTGIAAVFHDRRFTGIDLDPVFVEIARVRIASALDGTLKTRKIGTLIKEAGTGAKTKKYPEEWKPILDAQKSKKRIYQQYQDCHNTCV